VGWEGALILAATLAAYFPALGAGFVWDDDAYVTKPALRGLHGLWRIWFELGSTEQYYPLLHGAFWVEHRLWGDWAPAYHLVNVLLHAAAAFLFMLVLRRLLPQGAGSRVPLFAALLFALHPVCVESVAWISEQKNTQSTVFYLLAALFYLKWESGGRGSRRLYGAATLLFVAALLSKTVSATLPAALLVVAWWRRGRISWRQDVGPLASWIVLGGAAGVFSGWVERTYIGASGSAFALDLAGRFVLAGRVTLFYLGKLLWPLDLSFTYPRWQVDATVAWQWLFSLAVIALTLALALLHRRTRAPLAAWLFFVGSLVPTIGFFNIYAYVFSYVADHWQYLASLGVFALAAGAWDAEIRKGKLVISKDSTRGGEGVRTRRISRDHLPITTFTFTKIAPIFVCVVLGALTWRQCRLYHSKETLYLGTLRANPRAWMSDNNLGNLYSAQGRYAEAISHYDSALRVREDLAEAHYNLGLALMRTGRIEESVPQFQRAIRLEDHDRRGNDPAQAAPFDNLGLALNLLGRPEEAIPCFLESLRIAPDAPDVEYNLGNAYAAAERWTDALGRYRRALQLRPDYAAVHTNMGAVLAQTGHVPEGVAELREAIRIDPGYASAHDILGQILGGEGFDREGRAELEEAARLKAAAGQTGR